jgi:hypothetical protein
MRKTSVSYTYSGSPAASPVDATHFYLGDTDPNNPLSTDEECAFALCQYGQNPMLAAAYLAETKALTFATRPQMVRKGDRMTQYGDAVQGFLTLAKTLRMQASLATTTVYAGGLSVSEKDADRRNTDLPQPFARKNLHILTHPRSWETEEREP